MQPTPRPAPTLREWLLVTLAYTLLTLMLTYPVARDLGNAFLGDGHDGFQNTWNFWWVGQALGTGRSAFRHPAAPAVDRRFHQR